MSDNIFTMFIVNDNLKIMKILKRLLLIYKRSLHIKKIINFHKYQLKINLLKQYQYQKFGFNLNKQNIHDKLFNGLKLKEERLNELIRKYNEEEEKLYSFTPQINNTRIIINPNPIKLFQNYPIQNPMKFNSIPYENNKENYTNKKYPMSLTPKQISKSIPKIISRNLNENFNTINSDNAINTNNNINNNNTSNNNNVDYLIFNNDSEEENMIELYKKKKNILKKNEPIVNKGKKSNPNSFRDYSIIQFELKEEKYNPSGLFISKNNLKKRFTANETIFQFNPRKVEKRNTTFVPTIIKKKEKIFGKTHNNFYKDYINCVNNNKTQNNKENSCPKTNFNNNKMNVGFVPVSNLKIHYVDI